MGKTTLERYSKNIIIDYSNGKSTYDLAKLYNCHHEYIRKILIKNNIKRRTRSELNHMRFANHSRLSKKSLSMLTGWLLGDGHLKFVGKQTYFSLSSKYEEYANYVKKILEKDGINCRINTRNDKKNIYHYVCSRSTIQFSEIYNEWYIDKTKVVPKGLKLDKHSIKTWIMDDGTISKQKGHLRLCTCSFSIKECEYLSVLLNSFLQDNKASWVVDKKKYPRIYIPRVHAKRLFKAIGNCDIDCFKYKWDIR